MEKLSWSGEGEQAATVIGRARSLFQRHAPALARHARIPGLLGRYRQAIELTSQRTISLGVPSFCAACASQDGVCCFRGAERRYDEYLLLENLLLGETALWETCPGASCFYCGVQGCALLAKHSFCLNYYCPAIKQGLGAEAMAAMARQVGRELTCQWELERVLMPWLWGQASQDQEDAGPDRA